MFPRTTRLEFMIFAVALLVLLFCSQPPKSGNADVQIDVKETADEVPPAILRPERDNVPLPDESPPAQDESPLLKDESPPAKDESPSAEDGVPPVKDEFPSAEDGVPPVKDESAPTPPTPTEAVKSDSAPPPVAHEMSPTVQTPTRTERLGMVDARNCTHLNYKDVMYGKVTVRWVWNGQKLAPHKVCVVEESNGVSTVWSFDQQENVVISEILVQSDTSP